MTLRHKMGGEFKNRVTDDHMHLIEGDIDENYVRLVDSTAYGKILDKLSMGFHHSWTGTIEQFNHYWEEENHD